MQKYLNVCHKNKLVAKLWCDNQGHLGMRYGDDWLTTGFPISQQLPLSQNIYTPESKKAHRYFSHLLPEDEARNCLIGELQISNQIYELIKAIGSNCAGAISIQQADATITTQYKYRMLSERSILDLVRGNKHLPLLVAGAQRKCAISVYKQNYYLPMNGAPSTHILKFDTHQISDARVCEYFFTELARRVGLPVVEMQLRPCDNTHYLLIKRFDRRYGRNGIHHLHQEDFCQALGYDYQTKYEQDGGPSFLDCYRLLQRVATDPRRDCDLLLRWQIFNVLAGNSDGNPRNISLVYDTNANVRLAPFYDLVCTRVFPELESNLSFAVAGEYDAAKISVEHWHSFAKTCAINPAYVQQLVNMYKAKINQHLSAWHKQFTNDFGEIEIIQQVVSYITQQCLVDYPTVNLFSIYHAGMHE